MASKENINFLRSFLLLIEGGLYISKEILSRECQKSENDLDELLKINERKLEHLFHDKQYQKLFPEFGTADINCWDLQLLVGVLITVFGRDLKPGEKDKLKLLRYMRNETFMHCTTAALDESKYEEVIEELDDNITTLASTFDISVQQHCSNYIKQFTTGPLDAVRPSLPTLNGFSYLCQKKFKVGVQTELVIGGPSSTWTNLCEHTLETIFNHAESMASEDGGFQEIEGNVKKMLSYLESNKDIIFKECKRKCIILYFECKDYESFLSFLDKVESHEYKRYLCDLSNSLHSFFKPRSPISITSIVTSECLQSVLIDFIKTLSNEEKEQRHVVEISSEENIHEKKAMAMTSRDVHKVTKLINQSETSLLLNFELQSEEALPQMLQSFKGTQFSDSLTKVAGSLSRYCGSEITLKASMNVGSMLEALEESVFDKDALDTESESIYAKTSKEDELSLSGKECSDSSVNDDMTSERIYTITSKEADLQSLPVSLSKAVQTECDIRQKDTVSLSKAVQTERGILQKDSGDVKVRGVDAVTFLRWFGEIFTSYSETKLEHLEYNIFVPPSKAVQTNKSDILQKDTEQLQDKNVRFSEVFSKENIYFLRSICLLTTGGLYISKEILTRECRKPGIYLDELLKSNEWKLKRLFHVKQYRKLFPKFGKANIHSWDLQMTVFVLINVFMRDLTPAEMVKLRQLNDLRNDIYMHCTTGAIDESKYEDVIENLSGIITTLASTFDISVQQRCSNYIQQFTTGPLDDRAVKDSLGKYEHLFPARFSPQQTLETEQPLTFYGNVNLP